MEVDPRVVATRMLWREDTDEAFVLHRIVGTSGDIVGGVLVLRGKDIMDALVAYLASACGPPADG